MSDTKGSTVATWLADHPRLMGVMFATFLAIAQAGSVVADGSSYPGP